MSFRSWWKARCGGMEPAGYGTPLVLSARPILGVGYGLHLCHAPRGGGPMLKIDVRWWTVSGLVMNTPRGAVWLYFRRWAG